MKPTGVLASLVLLTLSAMGQNIWTFAVSGDSRNCGDVVMPAIATGVLADHASFYWHLGDFRAIYTIDDDVYDASMKKNDEPPSYADYINFAWDDFIHRQLEQFGTLPVYLAVGNHEFYAGKSRSDLMTRFDQYFDREDVARQRVADPKCCACGASAFVARTYYHWQHNGVDFISLDNGTADQFNDTQLWWLKQVLDQDAKDTKVKSIVVGMHKALPDSISCDHSMNEPGQGADLNRAIDSGRQVYYWLLDLRRAGKHVYTIASHSHFYMKGIFNLLPQQERLPGWIVGTAGAVRYPFPRQTDKADEKGSDYGYLLGTVSPSGEIAFIFKPVSRNTYTAKQRIEIEGTYSEQLLNSCWTKNLSHKAPPTEECAPFSPLHLPGK